jgi:hypothetical protein
MTADSHAGQSVISSAPAMPPPERRPGAIRVAVVLSHPIQYFAPLYRALARVPELELKVFFGARIGLEPYFDRDMQVELAWQTELVTGYAHAFTDRAGTVKEVGFWALNDPSLGRLLSAFAPQVVVIYGYSQLNQLRALLWARRRRVPVLMTGDSSLLAPRPGVPHGRAATKPTTATTASTRPACSGRR